MQSDRPSKRMGREETTELEAASEPPPRARQGGTRRTLRDELEAEGQLPLEDLDLAPLLLEREQVLAASAAAPRARRRRVHPGLPRRAGSTGAPARRRRGGRGRGRGRGEDTEARVGNGMESGSGRRVGGVSSLRLFPHGRRGGEGSVTSEGLTGGWIG